MANRAQYIQVNPDLQVEVDQCQEKDCIYCSVLDRGHCQMKNVVFKLHCRRCLEQIVSVDIAPLDLGNQLLYHEYLLATTRGSVHQHLNNCHLKPRLISMRATVLGHRIERLTAEEGCKGNWFDFLD